GRGTSLPEGAGPASSRSRSAESRGRRESGASGNPVSPGGTIYRSRFTLSRGPRDEDRAPRAQRSRRRSDHLPAQLPHALSLAHGGERNTLQAGPGDSAKCQPAGSPAYRDDDPARHYSDAAGQTRRGRTLPASSARFAPRVGWGGRDHHSRSKGLPG